MAQGCKIDIFGCSSDCALQGVNGDGAGRGGRGMNPGE